MENDWHLRHAARVLRSGGIIAHATEAVFGLACDPHNTTALDRLLELKSRSSAKGLILIGAGPAQVLEYASVLPAERLRVVLASWPGPVSWVVPARAGLDPHLTGGRGSIVLRVTDHAQARQLCWCFGAALISTSANISGHRPAMTELDVRRIFKQSLDYILPGRVGGQRRPSQIRDAVSDRILRQA